LNFNNKKTTYKEFCGCLGIEFYNIWWFVFGVLDPFILKSHNFFTSIPFFMIFGALDVPIGGVQVLFRRQKQWSPPLDLVCLERLSVIIVTQL